MEKKRFGCLGIGLIVLLCVSVFFNLILIVASSFKMDRVGIRGKAPKFEEATVVDATGSSTDKIACAGSHIIANETTLTGSIGVIIETLNYQQLFGKIGLDFVVFKSGKMKDMLSGSRTMTDEEKQYIQSLVMQTYDKFVGIVATERKLPVDDLKNGLADGRVISGKDAKKEKLIDSIGQIED